LRNIIVVYSLTTSNGGTLSQVAPAGAGMLRYSCYVNTFGTHINGPFTAHDGIYVNNGATIETPPTSDNTIFKLVVDTNGTTNTGGLTLDFMKRWGLRKLWL
jgi:hypothetical protein